jgi:hypothetical protein
MSWTTLRFFSTAAFALFAAAACGDGAPVAPSPDAGVGGGNATLLINEPPGQSLGLSFGGSATLSVTYLDAEDAPIAGAQVRFRMITSGSESTGGSTLSSTSVLTRDDGVAEVTLVAGAERGHFRVEVNAPDAPSAIFYIAVSEEGFTKLVVTPVHEGFRNAAQLLPVQIRLYRSDDHRCADIDVDDIPASIFPAEQVEAFGQEVSFPNRSSGDGYTVLAWGHHPEDLPTPAFGCVDLAAAQVRPGQSLRLSVMLSDRPVVLPEAATLSSRFDLSLLALALDDAGTSQPWDVLASCEAGPGQLLLDCIEGAIAEADDCEAGGDDPLIVDLQDLRGAVDEAGCRARELASGELSLDGALSDAIAAGGAPSAEAWAELQAARYEVLSDVELRSRLSLTSAVLAVHRLERLSLGRAEETLDIDLHDTARTVVSVAGIPVALSTPGGGQLVIAEHGFTLRLGAALLAAFRELALAPRDLAEEAEALGRLLAGSVDDPESDAAGCEAVSAMACRRLDEEEACLLEACEAGAHGLDAALSAWARLADGAGIDFALSGAALVADDAGDLIIDRFAETPSGARAGSWAATLFLSDDTPVELVGTFRGEID